VGCPAVKKGRPPVGLPEVPPGEGVARAFLEILLERQGFLFVLEVDGYDQLPGSPARGVRRCARVVLGQPFLEILGGSNVTLIGEGSERRR